jgi:hypothetical protein
MRSTVEMCSLKCALCEHDQVQLEFTWTNWLLCADQDDRKITCTLQFINRPKRKLVISFEANLVKKRNRPLGQIYLTCTWNENVIVFFKGTIKCIE